MKLTLIRLYDNGEETLGMLYFKDGDKCKYVYTLEDEYRRHKVDRETRIPAGEYEITPQNHGSIYQKYCDHKVGAIASFTRNFGVLAINKVPGFEGVLIHVGNVDEDTAGCVLVGLNVNCLSNSIGTISNSADAYVYLCGAMKQALENNEKITIEIKDNIYRKK